MKKELSRRAKIIRLLLLLVAGTLFLECFLFNFRFWQSVFFKEIDFEQEYTGIQPLGNDEYLITDCENACILFSNINAHVDNVYIYMRQTDSDKTIVPLNIYYTDAAHSALSGLPDTETVSSIIESQYIRVYLQGESKQLQIRFNNLTNGSIYSMESMLNAKRPLILHWWRILIIFVVLLLFYLFRPKSFLYKMELDLTNSKQLLTAILFILVTIVLFIGIAKVFRVKDWKRENTWMQYNYLAQSLLDGHTYLEPDPPEALAEMDNPYDPAQREQFLSGLSETYILDYAYYNGHYYCYFGIVPVLFFYLPYILLTGRPLNTLIPILFMTILFIITVFWFMETIIRRFFPKTSLGIYILLSSVLVAGSEITYGVQCSTLYSLPIIMGITLDLIGITCWLRAVRKNGKISKLYLIVGALLIALVIGCRPPLAIACLLAFPIFWKQIKERLFFSVRGLGNTCCIIIPFLLIGAAIMYYNYIRFDSPFNFGATYNLTGFDMTHRGIQLSRFGVGFFEYFFQPFQVSSKYPYVFMTSFHMQMASDYQGQLINESFLGGFFAFNIIGIFLLKIASCKDSLKKKGLWGTTVLLLLIGIIITAVDIQMIGITFRYLTDFSVFLMVGTIIIVFSLLESTENNKELYSRIFKWILILSIITIIINYYTLLVPDRYRSLVNSFPFYYYKIKYQVFSFLTSR